MSEAEKLPERLAVPVIAAVVLHALAPRTEFSGQQKVDAAFNYADMFVAKLRERGMLGK
jgi:hypothetical protein